MERKGEPWKKYVTAQIKAIVLGLIKTPQLWNALLIALGFVSFALAFPLYGLLVPVIAAIIFVIGWHNPVLATIVAVVAILPAAVYQSIMYFLLYMFVIALTLFEVFTSWYVIAAVLAIVGAPLTPPPMNAIFAPLIIPVLTFSAFRLGSKSAAVMCAATVYAIFLMSGLWHRPIPFFVLSSTSYAPLNMAPQKPSQMPLDILPALRGEIGAISQEFLQRVNEGLYAAWDVTVRALFADVGGIQIAAWTVVFYAIGLLPLYFERWPHFKSTLSLLLLIPLHFFCATLIDPAQLNVTIVPVTVATICAFWAIDKYEVKIAREEEIVAAQKVAAFGLIGVVDLSVWPGGPKSLAEVGGYATTKREIREAITLPIKYRELSLLYGIRPPRGILLFGPPGCGKTLLMQALAKELRMGFYYVRCSEILSTWYGESERNIARLFKAARKNAPCIIFIDEIDAIGKRRELYAADEVTPRVLSAMLTEMDGIKSEEGVIVVGATNVPNLLDPALLRPGRFDKIIYIPPPDAAAREEILRLYTQKLPLAPDVDIKELARKTERFSGADLANLVLETARRAAPAAAAARAVVPITAEDFTATLKTVRPSITFEMLEEYEKFALDFERRGVREEIAPPIEVPKVRWDDIIGLDDVKAMLREAIELPLLHPEKLAEFKVRPPRGILMFGPPGCGKTLLARAASTELGVAFITLNPADLSRVGYERGVELIKSTFNRAREAAPAVIFIDEIEAIAPAREYYKLKITSDIVSQLLQEMDGLRELKNVIVLGATNAPQMIDPALLRPGRFDKIIFVAPPNEEGRAQMFKHHLEGIPGAEQVDYAKLARESEGFTGADIAAICQDVKLSLVRQKIAGIEKPTVTTSALQEVLAKRTPSVTVKMLRSYLQFVKEFGERR